MEKPKIVKFDFENIKDQMEGLKETTTEKIKQGADTASEVAAKALKQGSDYTAAAAEKLKQGAEYIGEAADNAQEAYKNWRYRPIFADNLVHGDNAWLPEMLNIKNTDARTRVEGFSNVVGFDEHCLEKPIVTILSSYASEMDLEFMPTLAEDVYYVDPFDKHRYIQIDQYFATLEQERIEELISVAQDLGAKYIEISYSKDQSQSTGTKGEQSATAKTKKSTVDGSAGASAEHAQTERSVITVKKSMNLPGMEPKLPTLRHFKNDIEINSIIDRRLHKENAIKGDYRCELNFNTSSGIKASNAVNVEGALKKVGIKLKGKYKISEEVSKEDSQKLHVFLKFPE